MAVWFAVGRTQAREQFRTDDIRRLNMEKRTSHPVNFGKYDPTVDAENLIEENNVLELSVFKDGGQTWSLEDVTFIRKMKNRHQKVQKSSASPQLVRGAGAQDGWVHAQLRLLHT